MQLATAISIIAIFPYSFASPLHFLLIIIIAFGFYFATRYDYVIFCIAGIDRSLPLSVCLVIWSQKRKNMSRKGSQIKHKTLIYPLVSLFWQLIILVYVYVCLLLLLLPVWSIIITHTHTCMHVLCMNKGIPSR